MCGIKDAKSWALWKSALTKINSAKSELGNPGHVWQRANIEKSWALLGTKSFYLYGAAMTWTYKGLAAVVSKKTTQEALRVLESICMCACQPEVKYTCEHDWMLLPNAYGEREREKLT